MAPNGTSLALSPLAGCRLLDYTCFSSIIHFHRFTTGNISESQQDGRLSGILRVISPSAWIVAFFIWFFAIILVYTAASGFVLCPALCC